MLIEFFLMKREKKQLEERGSSKIMLSHEDNVSEFTRMGRFGEAASFELNH
jgi:hypothetical protein